VLDKGRVVQTGTHGELMSAGGHYRWAADLQTGDPEDRRLLGIDGGGGQP
jgi:ABC-type transport system involved in cytochrome bd biosynthesis fused ATPase/permease subunit